MEDFVVARYLFDQRPDGPWLVHLGHDRLLAKCRLEHLALFGVLRVRNGARKLYPEWMVDNQHVGK
jgi:hypothetical protein